MRGDRGVEGEADRQAKELATRAVGEDGEVDDRVEEEGHAELDHRLDGDRVDGVLDAAEESVAGEGRDGRAEGLVDDVPAARAVQHGS